MDRRALVGVPAGRRRSNLSGHSVSTGSAQTYYVFIRAGAQAVWDGLTRPEHSARYLFGALFYLLPNLSNYSYITPAAHGQTPPATIFLASLGYALIYIAVLLAAATLIFNRRNFK